jgi:hypothetical protein
MSNDFNEMNALQEYGGKTILRILLHMAGGLWYSERVADSGIWGIARPPGL